MSRHLLRSAGGVAAAAVLVAACGSSSKSAQSAPSPGATTAAAAAPAGAPIKIGMLTPIGAPFFNAPDDLAATRAAIRAVNAKGGIKGRPLQLDFCNEANDPNKATACARQFVSDGDVATVTSITITASDAVNQILHQAGMANVNYVAETPAEFSTANNFPEDGGPTWENAAAVGFAVQNRGLKRVELVRNDVPVTVAMEKLVKQAVQKTGGTFAGTTLVPSTAVADYSPLAAQIIKAKPDVVDLPLGIAQALGVVKAVRALGSNVTFTLNCGAFSNSDLAAAGSLVDGTLIFCANPWISDGAAYPAINQFLAGVKAEQAAGDSAADVNTMRPYSLRDWGSIMGLTQVMTQMAGSAQDITRDSFLKAFSGATHLSTGVMPDWSPSQPNTAVTGYTNVAITDGYVLQVGNGKQALLQKAPVDMVSLFQ